MKKKIVALAAFVLVAALPAQAREAKMVLPVGPVLRQAETQSALAGITVRFGAPEGQGRASQGTEVRARSWARPTDMRGFNGRSSRLPDGRPGRLSELQTCQLALRYTLVELVQEARKKGAQSVVDIVSINDDVEMNSATEFECIPGMGSSTVTLRGRAGSDAATVASSTQPQAQAGRSAAPIAPIASGFAALDDVNAVPYLSELGRTGYREYLTRPTPKAFAISPSGHWFSAWTTRPTDPSHPTDPVDRALLVCSQRAGVACKLYAVNGSVVWGRDSGAAVAVSTPAPSGRGHARTVPPASAYADSRNAEAVPVLPEGKQRYAEYLNLPAPKAYVVYEDGGWRFASASPTVMTTLLDGCAREGRKCWLYAVDNQVVWQENLQQRISRSDQLGGR
jgi:hypothetical protein